MSTRSSQAYPNVMAGSRDPPWVAHGLSQRRLSLPDRTVWSGPACASFGLTNLSALLVVLLRPARAPQVSEISTPGFVPSLHKLSTAAWKGWVRGQESCHMLHCVMA